MHTLRFLTALAVLGLLAACQGSSFGHRPDSADPDARLAALMNAYDESRAKPEDKSPDHQIVDPGRVRNEIERLALEFPQHVPTLLANGVLAYENKQPVSAARYLDAIFALEPSHPEAAIERARIAAEEGNLPFARRLIATQIEYRPDHAGLRESMASVQFMSRDYAAAASALDAAAKLGAPAWRVAFHRGLVAQARGDRPEAQRQFELAHSGNPGLRQATERLAGLQVTAP